MIGGCHTHSKIVKFCIRTNTTLGNQQMSETVERAVAGIKNLYYNGFERRARAFRITRDTIRSLADVKRLEGATLEKIQERLEEEEFVFYPLGTYDLGSNKEWYVTSYLKINKLPIIDEEHLKRAEQESHGDDEDFV